MEASPDNYNQTISIIMHLHASESDAAVPSARVGRIVHGQVLEATIPIVPESVVVSKVEAVVAIFKSAKMNSQNRNAERESYLVLSTPLEKEMDLSP